MVLADWERALYLIAEVPADRLAKSCPPAWLGRFHCHQIRSPPHGDGVWDHARSAGVGDHLTASAKWAIVVR